MKKKLSIINSLLNVNANEWRSVALAWALRYFFRIGFIISWTILTALFIARFGIDWLPLLFIVNALLITAGTYYFSRLVRNFSTIQLMNFTIFAGALLLFLAALTQSSHSIIFVSFLLLTHAVFFAQLEISIFSFTEELFTPLEGERVFPVIESGEILGAITGGVLVSLLSNIFPPYKIISFLIVTLFIIACFVRFYAEGTKELPRIYHHKPASTATSHQLQKVIQKIRTVSFLRHLFVIVGIFWIIYYLVQFEIMHFITVDVSATGVVGEYFEAALTHKIGTLEAIFHSSALLVQLLAASRIISNLGIVRSLIINPILMVISSLAIIFSPSFFTAALARTNLEIGSIIHLNAYHNSYYAVNHSNRGSIREFFEGYIRPLGAIIGMASVVILRLFTTAENTVTLLNALIILLAGISIYTIVYAQKSYSLLARNNLLNKHSAATKKHAIEILLQKGHQKRYRALLSKDLTDLLNQKNESIEVKIEALKALSQLTSPKSIASIVQCLSADSQELQMAAVHTLQSFTPQKISSEIINHLQQLILKETNESIRLSMIEVLIKANQSTATIFLHQALKETPQATANYVFALGLLKDPAQKNTLFHYLNSNDPQVSANALVALWQFPETHDHLAPKFQQLLHPADKEGIRTMLFVLSKTDFPNATDYILPQLKAPTPEIRLMAAEALAARGNSAAIEPYAQFICSQNEELRTLAQQSLNDFSPSIQRKIWKATQQNLSQQVRSIIAEEKVRFLEDLSPKSLTKLRQAYAIINDHQAIMDIDDLIA